MIDEKEKKLDILLKRYEIKKYQYFFLSLYIISYILFLLIFVQFLLFLI